MKPRPPSPPPDPADAEASLLAALHAAGSAGLAAAKLRLAGKTPAATARRDALAALVAQGRVQLLGTGKTARHVLAEHAPTAASVAARLLTLGAFAAGHATPTLWKELELRRKLPAHERPLLAPALEHLQAGRQLVAFRQGRGMFFAFAAPLRVWLDVESAAFPPASVAPASAPPPVPDENAVKLDDATLFFAYARLVRESGGFPDVKISVLQRALGVSAAPGTLAAHLAALWREGRATLSLGDWSLASEETRAAAVELDGEKYLLVRLDEECLPSGRE